MSLIVKPWEVTRAQTVADTTKKIILEGTEGAEVIFQQLSPALMPPPEVIDPQIRAGAYGMLAGLDQHEPWIQVGSVEVPFEPGMSNYGGGNRAVMFRKEHGRVFIRGLVAGAALNTIIFYLPPGYRPTEYENFSAMADGGWANLVITPDGAVYINLATSGTPENYATLVSNFWPD